MTVDLSTVEAVLHAYFDGLHDGDAAKLKAIFHADAHLFNVSSKGAIVVTSRDAFADGVASRPSAKSQGLAREDWIESLERSGPETACATVRCQIPPRYFTDYLTLAKGPTGWQIVSKTYHPDLRAA